MAQSDFTTPGADSFTVPVVVNSLTIYLIGGGGSGDAGPDGGGGGGGAYLDFVVSTSPGTTYDFVVGAAATATNWESGEYIAGGGTDATGSVGGVGGTVSGTELPADNTSDGGAGGAGQECCDQICNNCTCDNPPDCTSSSCADSSLECDDYRGGGGSAGFIGGPNSGTDATCGGGGDCGGTPYPGGAGADGTGGGGSDISGAGGNAGQNGNNYGGGGGGGGGTGATGIVRVEWTPGFLAFTTQPSNATANVAISPSVVVEAKFFSGATDSGYTGDITIQLDNNEEGATLAGTTTRAAVAGVATFNDVSVNLNGTYNLLATATSLTSANSNFFTITGGSSAHKTRLAHHSLVPKLAHNSLFPRIIR